MDKATLLAEVISEVKELKKKAAVASNGILIPMDADEVKVEPFNDEAHGSFSFMATLSCYYRPELLSDLRQALDTLRLKIVKAEISTLGNRLKYVFVFTSCEKDNENRAETCQLLAKSVHQALSSILDKVSFSPEYSTRTMLPLKRRRLSFFDASSSSSGL